MLGLRRGSQADHHEAATAALTHFQIRPSNSAFKFGHSSFETPRTGRRNALPGERGSSSDNGEEVAQG
jgi:hypothetical protein